MKSKILKFIFILSFIPYLMLVLTTIDMLIDGQWIDLLVLLVESIYYSTIIILCATFQICYIYRKKTKMIFICSFIPYILVLFFALGSAFLGISFLGPWKTYGLEVFFIGLVPGGVFYGIKTPIMPVCLIFQIIYLIRNRRSKRLKENNILE